MLSLGDDMTECLLLLGRLYLGGGTINPGPFVLSRDDLSAYGPEVGMVSGGLCIVSHCFSTLSPASSPLPKITLDIFLFNFLSSVAVL